MYSIHTQQQRCADIMRTIYHLCTFSNYFSFNFHSRLFNVSELRKIDAQRNTNVSKHRGFVLKQKKEKQLCQNYEYVSTFNFRSLDNVFFYLCFCFSTNPRRLGTFGKLSDATIEASREEKKFESWITSK